MADTRAHAETAFDRFVTNYGAKYPKATECLAKDRAALLAFYDFPAEHWIHIRSSNVIESSFATIRHRTDRTKGCLTRDGMLAMIYKLGQSAERSWRRLLELERGLLTDQLALVPQHLSKMRVAASPRDAEAASWRGGRSRGAPLRRFAFYWSPNRFCGMPAALKM
jgi:transposase-like protein